MIRERIVGQIVDLRVARESTARRQTFAERNRDGEGASNPRDITLAEYDRQISELRRLLNSGTV